LLKIPEFELPYGVDAENGLNSAYYASGPFRGRVRTLGDDFDTVSNNTHYTNDSKHRAVKMFEIFRSVADRIMDGILPDLPANDNTPYPSSKSLKSLKSFKS